jgi:hypothetical protein
MAIHEAPGASRLIQIQQRLPTATGTGNHHGLAERPRAAVMAPQIAPCLAVHAISPKCLSAPAGTSDDGVLGTPHIMARDIAVRTTGRIVVWEKRATPTGADHQTVGLAGLLEPALVFAMQPSMGSLACRDYQICGYVMAFDLIVVMDFFVRQQWPAEFLLRHEDMLVDIAPDISAGVVWFLDQYITTWVDCPPALPVRIFMQCLCALLAHRFPPAG